MKHRITPLLISCFIILTSMSECQKGEIWFLNYVEYSPINAELNGVLFTSGYYKYIGWGGGSRHFVLQQIMKRDFIFRLIVT